MNQEKSTQPMFHEWAIVELFGHTLMAGRVSEQVVAGQGFVRVDVPEVEDPRAASARPGYTRLIGPSAIYAINPTTEEAVRLFVAQRASAPIAPYIPALRQLPVRVDLEETAAEVYRSDAGDDYMGEEESL